MRGLLLCRRTRSGFTTSHHRATTDCALPARNQGKRISVISELTGLWLQTKSCNFGFLKKKRWGKANHPNHKPREEKHLSEISQEHTVNLHKESAPKIPHKSVGIKWQLMSSQNHIKNTSKFFKKLKKSGLQRCLDV